MKTRKKILLSMSTVHSDKLSPIVGDTNILYSDIMTAQAIYESGGLPVYIPSIPNLNSKDIAMYLQGIDGVVITGQDAGVDPVLYGERQTVLKSRIDSSRDVVDDMLIRHAYKSKLPLLGICKGMQIINVTLGGTLYQGIARQCEVCTGHSGSGLQREEINNEVNLVAGSIIREIFGMKKVGVNDKHSEGIKHLSPKLRATAIADDGIIEVFEGRGSAFVMGVQFHPELRLFDKPFREIFNVFMRNHETTT